MSIDVRPSAAASATTMVSYQEILDTDTRPVPEILRRSGTHDVGPLEVPVDWYLDAEVFRREEEMIWRRRWQVACREEDLREVGDTWVYEVASLSILIARVTEADIKAYYNSCLHRGRALRDAPGRVRDFQCPFHGFTWNLDGSSKRIPCAWDFEHIDAATFRLPEVRVETWGGFVWVNPDPDAESLASFLGELPEHFSRWPLERRFKRAHVAKVIHTNWKLAQEAFMESYHTITTHPEILPSLGDANSQLDAFGNVSRAMSAIAFPSPHMMRALTEQEILDNALGMWEGDDPMIVVPDGLNARAVLAEAIREQLIRPTLGADEADQLSDAEMVDAIYYSVYPNLHPWGGYGTLITYRFLPWKNSHEHCLMEVMLLAPYAGDEPPPSTPLHMLCDEENWLAAPELGILSHIFQQDMLNMEELFRGLRNNQRGRVTFGTYQELKIRHFYDLYMRDMGFEA